MVFGKSLLDSTQPPASAEGGLGRASESLMAQAFVRPLDGSAFKNAPTPEPQMTASSPESIKAVEGNGFAHATFEPNNSINFEATPQQAAA